MSNPIISGDTWGTIRAKINDIYAAAGTIAANVAAVLSARDEAEDAADASQASATASETSRQGAQSSATAAAASQQAAATARTGAETARDQAQASATTATGAASTATTKASEALASANSAAGSATTAQASANALPAPGPNALRFIRGKADGTGFEGRTPQQTREDIGAASAADVAAAVPAGAVMHFARQTAPAGWLKADGAAVSRTTYAALFSAIGTTFGTGDGSTTFNLPDLRAEFIRGLDDGRGIDTGRALGSAQEQQIQSHTHTQTRFVQTASIGQTVAGANNAGAATANYATLNTGATGGTETRPRNVALLACIKI